MPTVSELLSQNVAQIISDVQTWSIFYNALEQGCAGDGTTDDYAALNTLFNQTITTDALVIFPRGSAGYRIASNLTVPSNVVLYFVGEATLKPDTGVTVAINGGIIAGIYPIFSGAGTIIGNPIVEKFFPQWWGATGDGATDDTAEITAMKNTLTTNGGTAFFPKGNYLVTDSALLTPPAGVTYVGDAALSNFKVGATLTSIPAYSIIPALTVSRALVSNGSGIVTASAVTSTQLGYLSTTTSDVQTQLNAKSPLAGSSSIVTVGTVTAGVWNGTAVDVAHGGSGAVTLTGILKGNGTGAFTAVTAPVGAIVGTTDSQTLTNKTITGSFTGNLTGNADSATTVTTNANLTGDVTSIGNVTTIGASKITSAMIVNGTIVDADINASAAIDAAKIGPGTVSNTVYGYLVGVTSAIQTQLNAKATTAFPNIASPTQTTITAASGTDTLNVTGSGSVVVTTNNTTKTINIDVSGVGTGTVNSVNSANADISVATTTTTPVLTLNSGAGASQICKRDGSGNFNATTVTTNANLTGDVTSTGNATTIKSNVALAGAPTAATAAQLTNTTQISTTAYVFNAIKNIQAMLTQGGMA
jgi:hypothetical protein